MRKHYVFSTYWCRSEVFCWPPHFEVRCTSAFQSWGYRMRLSKNISDLKQMYTLVMYKHYRISTFRYKTEVFFWSPHCKCGVPPHFVFWHRQHTSSLTYNNLAFCTRMLKNGSPTTTQRRLFVYWYHIFFMIFIFIQDKFYPRKIVFS